MSRILVADDNSNIQKMVGIALKDQGVEVLAVGNGEAAVRKLSETIPDLILADIFMPVRNGYEVCEYVKKDDRFAHVPVVLLVGAFDPLDEREVERVRADGVLKKPFVPPEPLIELVKSLLGKNAPPPPAAEPASEDIEQTQDIGLSPHKSTGTLRMPATGVPPTERTQRLEPETPAARSEVPPTERTQRLEPEGAPASAEGFKLGLDEPVAPKVLEETAKLSANAISGILKRDSPLAAQHEPDEEFAVPPSVVDFHGEESPLAFEDMLRPTDEEEAPEASKRDLGIAAFDAAEEQGAEAEHDEAEIHFGGIREEAKTPDPEMPPIPVDFGHSEPMELITEEHTESSTHSVGPAEDLVSSSSGWAASTATEGSHSGAPEPGLEHEGSEGFMTPPPPPALGIAAEALSSAPEFPVPASRPAEGIAAEQVEEPAELPKEILQEDVSRAQEIAARVAAQNREFAVREESAVAEVSAPRSGPAIDQAINAADTILARHRAQLEAAAAASAGPALVPPVAAPEASAPAPATPPPVEPARPSGTELVDSISERVLSQLDPYLIEKISKEIVKPLIEAMIRKELEKNE